jgi:uncharacterized protein (DUF4415 family)
MSGDDIRQYSAEDLRSLRQRGGSTTNWARVDAQTEAELEAAIACDPDWKDVPKDWWKRAQPISGNKRLLSLRLDPDVVEWFRAQGPGYQTRMNAVLRAYMEAVRSAAAE